MKCQFKSFFFLAELFLIITIVCILYNVFSNGGGIDVQFKNSEEVVLMSYKELNPHCSDNFCINYLTEEEKTQYHSCFNTTISEKVVRKFGPIHPGKCVFQPPVPHPIGLGSFQGSGNTWLRGLLEKITGICTGSRYCDGALRTHGFNGEGVYGPSVIAVKFHSINPLFTNMKKLPKRIPPTVPVFGAAIVLIRNPRDSLVAEWHREKSKRQSNVNVSNHFLYVGKEYFGMSTLSTFVTPLVKDTIITIVVSAGQNPDWRDYVTRMTDRWKRHICGWLINGYNNPIHIIAYESLKANKSYEMFKALEFLGGKKLSLEYISSKISLDYNKFYRNHTDSFEHYSPDQEKYISQIVLDTINLLKVHYHYKSRIFEILNSYI